MEDEEKEEQDADLEGTNSWLKDNLRIIISIIIVVVIAGGVYSYSKRNQAPVEKNGLITEEQTSDNEGAVEVQKGDETQATTPTGVKQNATTTKQVAPAGASQETENSFIETAAKGDGTTRLARRALANYLEKNPDSSLTPEHKIYIEDFLRKKSGFKGRVGIGTSVEFSKDLIAGAIQSSKNLNDKQLTNLHKYAVRVPSLT